MLWILPPKPALLYFYAIGQRRLVKRTGTGRRRTRSGAVTICTGPSPPDVDLADPKMVAVFMPFDRNDPAADTLVISAPLSSVPST
jgi:hypothetical protein